ncbi:hypothetical protein JW872_01885 [Candidatus Babeliales bacterium]|nr:hypothetical protein [Candidatus Babeliales bacterium]
MPKNAALLIPLLVLHFGCSLKAMEQRPFPKERFEAALNALAHQTIPLEDFAERVAILLHDNLRDQISGQSRFVDQDYFRSQMEQFFIRVNETYEQRIEAGDHNNARSYLLRVIQAVSSMKARFAILASNLHEQAQHDPEWDACMCAVCDATKERPYSHMDAVGKVYTKTALRLLADRPTGTLAMFSYRRRMNKLESRIGSEPYAEAHIRRLLQLYTSEQEISRRLTETETELRTVGSQQIAALGAVLKAKAFTFSPPPSDAEFDAHFEQLRPRLEQQAEILSAFFISQAREAATRSRLSEPVMNFETQASLFVEAQTWLRIWEHCVKSRDRGALPLLEGQGRQFVTTLAHTQGDEETTSRAQELLIKIADRLFAGIPNGVLDGFVARIALHEPYEQRESPEALAPKAHYLAASLEIADRITELERQRRQQQELRRIQLDMLE